MDVFWFQQTDADAPADDLWLSPAEVTRLSSFRVPKRRADWRLGRWTAKQAYLAYLAQYQQSSCLNEIEAHADASGAPGLFVAGKSADVSISITHCTVAAACAIASSDAVLGCDMECVESRSQAFVADYFTDEERALVAQWPAAEKDLVVNLIWSAKESALKALREGLRLDTRSVTVYLDSLPSPESDAWLPLHTICNGGRVFHGWWRHIGNFVQTVVADPRPAPPIVLQRRFLASGGA